MITAVEIENFKGIRERTRIEIRPITLLFGPNSAGKSTLLHALQLAREVFTRRNLDVDVTEGGAGFIDLGGFRNYVHGRDLDKGVTLRFDLDLSSTDFLTEFPVPEYLISVPGRPAGEERDVSTIGDEIETGWVEIELRWSELSGRAGVVHYTVGLNGQPFARTLGGSEVAYLNIYHPLVRWEKFADDSIGVLDHLNPAARPAPAEQYFTGLPIEWTDATMPKDEFLVATSPGSDGLEGWWLRSVSAMTSSADGEDQPVSIIYAARPDGGAIRIWGVHGHVGFWTQGGLYNYLDGLLERPHPEELSSADRFDRGDPADDPIWAYIWTGELEFRSESSGGIPGLDRELSLIHSSEWGDEPSEEGSPRLREPVVVFQKLLSRLLLVPGRALRNDLRELRYVGPVRDAVPRNFVPPRFPDPSRWAGGLAAWEELSRSPRELCPAVSGWLSGEDRLNTGYGVEAKEFFEVPADHPLAVGLMTGRLFADYETDEIRRLAERLPVRRRVVLVGIASGTTFLPQDVGQGITQAIPVITAALDPAGKGEKPRGGLVGIEQPELHLNPRQQAALGDVFIAAALQAPKNRFVLETHSEHLILRLQRRIREATRRRNGEQVGDDDPVQADVTDAHVGVYYARQEDGHTVVTNMPLDLNGEFVIPWPDDFFEIDFHERFGR
jgi:hypothetical protein